MASSSRSFPTLPCDGQIFAGKTDLLLWLAKSQYATIKNDPDLNVHGQPLNWLNALRFNCTKGVCQDVRVRQAISQAIDR